jgi:hypothetical protein
MMNARASCEGAWAGEGGFVGEESLVGEGTLVGEGGLGAGEVVDAWGWGGDVDVL